MAHGQHLELGRRGKDLEEALCLGARLKRGGEELDRRVLDVVVRRDHPEVERRGVHAVLDRDAPRGLQVPQRGLDELGEVVGEMAVGRALQVVVVRVLRQPAVHERPREVVDGVLLVLDRLRHHLGAHVVVEVVVQVGLDGERLVEKLAVEGLLGRVAEEHALARVVDERPTRASDHLQDVGDGVVGVAVLGAVVELGVHQHDEVRLQRRRPAHRVRHHEHLQRTRVEERAHGLLLALCEALVQEADAVRDRVLKGGLVDPAEEGRDVVGLGVQEALGLVIGRRKREQVDRRQLRLLGRRHVDKGGAVDGVVDDSVVRGLRHREQPRRHVGDVKALDVHLERDGAHVGVEVEDAVRRASNPLCEVLGVGERRREGHDARFHVGLRRDVTHARDDDL
mmetsp:Transcript_15351/g.26133  ORF Transcript_15351/g.26133 Transcript_15351/m.26133 type:complete len:396 (-) Transcript_15351:1333-2520(-)